MIKKPCYFCNEESPNEFSVDTKSIFLCSEHYDFLSNRKEIQSLKAQLEAKDKNLHNFSDYLKDAQNQLEQKQKVIDEIKEFTENFYNGKHNLLSTKTKLKSILKGEENT